MAKTIMIVGFGPGTATAVAEKFGAEGFNVAVVGRNQERLDAGVAALKAKGISAQGFPADAGDPASIQAAVRLVRSKVGPIDVLHWNAYTLDAGDLLAADTASLHRVFDVAVFGLVAAAAEALVDLKRNGDGAILVSNGALSNASDASDEASVAMKMMGLALSGAAKDKLVGLLRQRLKSDGIYVGEVMVYATIKGTPGQDPSALVDPKTVAQKHWEHYQSRNETRGAIKLEDTAATT